MRMSLLLFALVIVHGQRVIEDFSGANPLSHWVFSNGAEFPGAKGNFTLCSTPWGGKCGQLNYDLHAGHYVSAMYTLPAMVPTVWLSITLNAPSCLHPNVRVVDTTGQTHQFPVSRSLDWDGDDRSWFRTVIDVRRSASHWGGANDGVLHGGIAAVALLAADPCSPSAGAMLFTNLAAFTEVDATPLRPVPLQANSTTPWLAPLPPRSGVNIHFTRDDRALDILHGSLIKYVRMDLEWSGVERVRGQYDFSAFDALVTSLAARSMDVLLILDYTNALYNPPSCPQCSPETPEAVAGFAAYSAAAVTHFKGRVRNYEVYNEPNIGFWHPKPNASAYAVLLKATAEAVKKADPSVLLSSGGTSGFDFAFLRVALSGGNVDLVDAVGVHPYRQGSPETARGDLMQLRELVRSLARKNPPAVVWDTEWGYSSTWYGNDGHTTAARHLQAIHGVRRVLTSWVSDVPRFVIYDVRDDGNNPADQEHNFGMIANDYSDKPLMVGVRTLFQTVQSARAFLQPSTMGPSPVWGAHVLQLESSPTVLIVWSEALDVDVRVPNGASVKSMTGQSVTLKPINSEQQFLLGSNDGPVYVTVPR